MTNFNTNTHNHDEWLTPPVVLSKLGEFDLDPCAPTPDTRPWNTAKKHYSIIDDGLSKVWKGRVFCNPPYGRQTFKWLDRLATHGNGVGLIFARTETIGFHEQVWARADAVFFFKGGLKFHRIDGSTADTANAPSCLIAYGQNNVDAIKSSGIVGKLVVLNES